MQRAMAALMALLVLCFSLMASAGSRELTEYAHKLLETGYLPQTPVLSLAVDWTANPPALYAGTLAGVYTSVNRGAHWTVFGTGLPNTAVAALVLQNGILAAATANNLSSDNPAAYKTEFVPFYSDYDHPAVFWIMNGWNDFQYNMAAGATTCGACYWWLPAGNSGPSQYEFWDGYASQNIYDPQGTGGCTNVAPPNDPPKVSPVFCMSRAGSCGANATDRSPLPVMEPNWAV